MKTVIIIMFSLLICISAEAATPSKPPVLKICASPAGTMLAKKKCGKNEVTITTENLGQQGPQGPAGQNGTFDPSKCVARLQVGLGTSNANAELRCGAGEYLLTHGMYPSHPYINIGTVLLLFREGEQAASGVWYYILNNNPSSFPSFSINVQGVCCSP